MFFFNEIFLLAFIFLKNAPPPVYFAFYGRF
jgi:hypothetical protein